MLNHNIIKQKLKNSNDIKDKFYYSSILNLLKKKISINLKKDDMIFIKPNYKYLIPNENINSDNFDIAFFSDLNNTKIVNS